VEFKVELVLLAHSSPVKSIRQLAYELDTADQTLRNQSRHAHIDRGEREDLITREREELSRLRRENRILRECSVALVRLCHGNGSTGT
jgi:transposase